MLTAAQITALTTDLGTNTNNVTLHDGTVVQIKNITAQQKTSDNAFAVAALYNLIATTPFWAYYRAVPVPSIKGAIKWKRLTPVDAVPTDTALNAAIWQARCQACQIDESIVRDLMSMGTAGTIDATPASVSQGFNDALSAVPSAASGAAQDAGWATAGGVQSVLCRQGTNAEKVFADLTHGTGANQNGVVNSTGPATFVYEGAIQPIDVGSIWGLSF
jgi:hypothetical protein